MDKTVLLAMAVREIIATLHSFAKLNPAGIKASATLGENFGGGTILAERTATEAFSKMKALLKAAFEKEATAGLSKAVIEAEAECAEHVILLFDLVRANNRIQNTERLQSSLSTSGDDLPELIHYRERVDQIFRQGEQQMLDIARKSSEDLNKIVRQKHLLNLMFIFRRQLVSEETAEALALLYEAKETHVT